MSDLDLDDRPRKKKKKKHKSKKGLMIALIAGGAVILIAVVLIIVLSNKGDDDKKPGPVGKVDPKGPPAKEVVPGPLVVEGGKTRLGKYIRAIERTEAEFVLRTVHLAWMNFQDTFKRGPKDQKELEPFYERNNRVTQSLDDKEGWLIFIYGVGTRNMPEGPERTVLAYEKEADGGYRYVLLGNGTFSQMPEDEFQGMPKAKGK